jgi:hypothetical protein
MAEAGVATSKAVTAKRPVSSRKEAVLHKDLACHLRHSAGRGKGLNAAAASVPIPKFVRLLSTLRTNFGIVRTLASL